MTPKPDARTLPTQDEFDSWCQHPVTQFVAEAYRIGAQKQREAWDELFNARLVPADLTTQRDILRTREDAYNAFLETTLDDYIATIASAVHAPGRAKLGSGAIAVRPQDGQRRAEPRKDRRGAA